MSGSRHWLTASQSLIDLELLSLFCLSLPHDRPSKASSTLAAKEPFGFKRSLVAYEAIEVELFWNRVEQCC